MGLHLEIYDREIYVWDTDMDWQRHCNVSTNVCIKVDDLLLGRLLHADAIFRATEDTTQIVEGAEASTLVCQHLFGQSFPQALCVYAIDACELILRLHPLRSELRRQGLLVVLAHFPSTGPILS